MMPLGYLQSPARFRAVYSGRRRLYCGLQRLKPGQKVLVICRKGGTVDGWPLDEWVKHAKANGCTVTVRDPDECKRVEDRKPVDCTIDEWLGI